MKRKIGELRNVPIVEGDKNLVRGGAEIHINDLQSKGSSSGSSSKYAPKYYIIGKGCPDELEAFFGGYASTIKQDYNGRIYISPISSINNVGLTLIGFSFNPIHTEIFGVNRYIDSIEDLCTLLEGDTDLILQNIERITEEEYYKID